jgi:hypothetical protein
MLSILGRSARIIQAHMCPEEQRLKVRYSQRFDFCHNASAKKDLFLRWLLSDPVTEMKPMSDGHDLSTSPAGDTAPMLTPFSVSQNTRNTTCLQDTPNRTAVLPAETQAPRHVLEQSTPQSRSNVPHMPPSGPRQNRRLATCYNELSKNFAAMSISTIVPVA